MSKRGRGGASGAKFRVSLGLPVGAVSFPWFICRIGELLHQGDELCR